MDATLLERRRVPRKVPKTTRGQKNQKEVGDKFYDRGNNAIIRPESFANICAGNAGYGTNPRFPLPAHIG